MLPFLAKLKSSSLGYRFARGAFWSLGGTLISRVLTLLSSIIVARLLGKTGFGELGIIQSTLGMLGVFAGFGLNLATTKFIAEFRVKDPIKVGRIMALTGLFSAATGLLTMLVLITTAPWLAEHTLRAPQLAGLLRIGSLLLLLGAMNGTQIGALSGFEAFKRIAQVNFLAGILSFPAMVIGVYYYGLKGATIGLVFNSFLTWFLNHLALRLEARRLHIHWTFSGCLTEWRLVVNFSIPLVFGSLFTMFATWACNALLVNQQNGYAEMGIYNAVMRIKQIPETLLSSLLAPILPILSEHFSKKDSASYNRTLSLAYAISFAVNIPFSLIIAASPDLTLIPFGKEFRGHSTLVQWLMVHSVQIGLFSPLSSVLASMNRMWFGGFFNFTWGSLFFLLSYWLVPKYLAVGLAASLGMTHLLTSLPCVAYIYRYEHVFIRNTSLNLQIAIVLPLFALCVIISQYFNPLYSSIIGGLVTILCSVLFLKFTQKNLVGFVSFLLKRKVATREDICP